MLVLSALNDVSHRYGGQTITLFIFWTYYELLLRCWWRKLTTNANWVSGGPKTWLQTTSSVMSVSMLWVDRSLYYPIVMFRKRRVLAATRVIADHTRSIYIPLDTTRTVYTWHSLGRRLKASLFSPHCKLSCSPGGCKRPASIKTRQIHATGINTLHAWQNVLSCCNMWPQATASINKSTGRVSHFRKPKK